MASIAPFLAAYIVAKRQKENKKKEDKIMKKMIYNEDWFETPQILAEGEFEGRYYFILNLGTHPTAYVRLKKEEYEKYSDYNNYNLDVHCGPTFLSNLITDKENVYIGWDYGHCGDFSGRDIYYERKFGLKHNGLKKWTTEEIFEEVKTAIKQLNSGEFYG